MEVNMIKLPAITLRGLTALPRQIFDLEVGRDESVLALQAAQKADHRLFLVTQRQPQQEHPAAEDLYENGIIGEIVFYEPHRHSGTVHVKIEGLSAAGLKTFLLENGIPTALVEEKKLSNQPDGADASRMRRALRELASSYASATKKISPEGMNAIRGAANLDEALELTASMVQMDYLVRQKILDAPDRQTAYDLVCLAMETGLEDAELLEHLRESVRRRVEKGQREYLLREQLKVIQEELGEEGPPALSQRYADQLKKLDCTDEVRNTISGHIARLRSMSSGSPEANSLMHYIETLLEMPWNHGEEAPCSLKEAEDLLEKEHYGLTEVKERILEYLAVRSLTGKGASPILCLAGPPGTGKTSIARSVAKALGRRYQRIGLGGVHDEAEIRGHRRTYIGAMPGRIAEAVRKSGVCNPLILLDEADKLNASVNGDPSAALLEALDSEQNSRYMDHYLDIPLDVSDVVFICTANDISGIPGPLRDRLEIIEVDSYSGQEKFHIAKEYLVPKQLEKNGLRKKQLTFTDKALYEIADGWTSEGGVRQLERCIGRICRKAARRIMEGEIDKIRVKASDLPKLLGKRRRDRLMKNKQDEIGVVRGLAWTSAGGVTLEVEVNKMPGRGDICLTGQMGTVMQESAAAAMSYVRSRTPAGIMDFSKVDFHIHIPEGAVPKDGPSAGITMAAAVWSAVYEVPVRADTAMTGEISLRGRVLPIGGLKEKLLAAGKAGMSCVLVPEANRGDVKELSPEILGDMRICYVKTMEDVLHCALAPVQTGAEGK